MAKKIANLFYQPILFFFLLPVFQLIIGSFFSIPYGPLKGISSIFLYLFVLWNQLLENNLMRIPNTDYQLNKTFLLIIESLNILSILYFGFMHSWLASLVLVLYSLFLQGQFLFSYYDLELLAAILVTLLKITFMNSFSFYTNTGFIQWQLLLHTIPLLFPFLLYEVSPFQTDIPKKVKIIFVVLSYLTGLTILWQYGQLNSLYLLLSLPFVWLLLQKDFNRKSTLIFSITFSIFYSLLFYFI